MRIKFGDKIYLCTKIANPEGGNLLIATTSNGVYTIDMVTDEQAQLAFNNLLVNGYYDVSKFEYSN